jgi:hypothetical protein
MSKIPQVEPHTLKIQVPTKQNQTIAKQLLQTHPIGILVKEIIEVSYKIYTDLLEEVKKDGEAVTILCGGQSPAYYCFCMTQFKVYDPKKVNIIVLPYSSGREIWEWKESKQNAEAYCQRLDEWLATGKGLTIHKSLVYLDYIESGRGIASIRRTIDNCFKRIFEIERERIYQLELNSRYGRVRAPGFAAISKSYKTEGVILASEILPRIVKHYPPKEFSVEGSLEPYFIGVRENKFLPMFQQCAEGYPKTPVEETEWYTLNLGETNVNIQSGGRTRRKQRTH